MSSSTSDQAAAGARIAVAAGLLGIDAQSMLAQLFEVASSFEGATVLTDADVQTLGIAIDLPEDALLARRMARLAEGISGAKALARAAMARPGLRQVERGIGAGGPAGEGMAGVFAALSTVGPATLDEDLAAAIAIGLDATTATSIGDRIARLTDGRERRIRLLRTVIYSGEPGRDVGIELATEAPPDLLERLARPEAGIAEPQLRLLANVHPILAATAPVWLRCGVGPGLTLVYRNLSLETCEHVIHGLATRDAALPRFGSIVGAIGATRARSLELALGPIDPVPARIGLPVTA